MGILCWSLVRETPRCLRPSPLPVWQLLLLLSLRLSPRLLLIPTFSMADMEDMVVILDMLVLDMLDTDTLMVLDMPTTDKLYLTPTSKWTAKHPCFLYQ